MGVARCPECLCDYHNNVELGEQAVSRRFVMTTPAGNGFLATLFVTLLAYGSKSSPSRPPSAPPPPPFLRRYVV